MKTQVERAREGKITPQCRSVAKKEGISPEIIASRISRGSVVIMRRGTCSTGIGEGLRTKVNVNIGTSSERHDPREEVRKAKIAEMYGADTISDLSMGPDIEGTRKLIFKNTSLPITTVPVYQTASETGIKEMTGQDILRTIRAQAKEGVSSLSSTASQNPSLIHIKKIKGSSGWSQKGAQSQART